MKKENIILGVLLFLLALLTGFSIYKITVKMKNDTRKFVVTTTTVPTTTTTTIPSAVTVEVSTTTIKPAKTTKITTTKVKDANYVFEGNNN